MLADTASIKVDCSGNAPSSNLCETACGANAACDDKAVGECTSATSLQKCDNSCSPVSSCGDGTVNCGEDCEPPNTAACDANCKSTCKSCASPKTLGTLSNYGDALSAATCAISSTMQDDIFKFTLNKPGYVVATLTSTTAGIGIDGIAKKGTNYCSPPILCNTDGSTSSSNPTISCSFYASSLGEYGYVATWGYGSGSAIVTAALYECIADNAIDSACPLDKPYCSSNKCVECMIDTDCKGTDGTYNTYCPKDSTTPNYILPSCTVANTCQCATSCVGNAECAPNFCCTAESPQGPNIKLPGKTEYTCEPKGTTSNPWLCT